MPIQKRQSILQVAGLVLLLVSCRQGAAPPLPPEPQAAAPSHYVPVYLKPEHRQELTSAFSEFGYSVDTLERGVPPFLLERLPADFHLLPDGPERKDTFFLSLLPMVLMANEEIRQQRQIAVELCQRLDRHDRLENSERERLQQLAREYQLKGDPFTSATMRSRLLSRIDTLPPDLVLAQAANESGWGTSRFALEANNLFGEWTFTPGTGVVPRRRPTGESYEVRRFDSLYDSVKSYMRNLNTHQAYRELRDLRENLRHRGHTIEGNVLATGLLRYSTRGEDYVADLKEMMRSNQLHRFREVALRQNNTYL